MKVAIVNIGTIFTGAVDDPVRSADTVICEDGLIRTVGSASPADVESCNVVIDAGGATLAPGLIDSHVHITFGDYTPRQKTVGFLESYLQGGVTTSITASEVHTPGRPKDREGLKALALAARGCFEGFRPGGMRVHAGAVILEPTLEPGDMAELAAKGVWLAKAGFGAFETPYDYAELVAAARAAGMITLMHTGGASIPGSSGIWADHVIRVNPHVSFHVNGGPVAMPEADFPRIVNESEVALQICTAGNLRTALLTAALADAAGAFERVLIATDTPTGSGIMPLGMLYTISHLSALGGIDPARAYGAATGSNARVYGLNCGLLAEGRDADLVILDACEGGAMADAQSALANGDICAVGAVISNGVPRFVGRSRNTPPTRTPVRVVRSDIINDFSA
ncbi:amidohydrolase [Acuticoccus sediminis]|uniref:Amidohydrolase n=1 Tax=Acuticoccus sediminis TaxID=2184697 RepID=A0A8B2NVW4_9HYPH|nr:amidohydrolase family protein [Acuticoccus sediminis]RAI01913.1 amidohydrolase [Acuticoccus sediminis]